MDRTEQTGERPRVVVYRGHVIESRHRVSFAIASSTGEVRHAFGKMDRPIYPRSAIKMLQAIPLVESGAADHFGLTPAELALACASHNGEPRHAETVKAWLSRLNLSQDDLECGAHAPSHGASADRLAHAGIKPNGLHNNCSGKHAGMLTLARHLGFGTKGYIRPDHPVQQIVGKALSDMAGVSSMPTPAIDGCGIPTYPIPLPALAIAMARFAKPLHLTADRAAACRRLANAMMQHPEMVAGEGRACTLIMEALPGIVVKTGAEGVFTAAWLEHGLGLALKVEDGATRASSVALLALLDRLGAIDATARADLQDVARPTLKNHAGTVVGHIEPADHWPDLPIDGTSAPR